MSGQKFYMQLHCMCRDSHCDMLGVLLKVQCFSVDSIQPEYVFQGLLVQYYLRRKQRLKKKTVALTQVSIITSDIKVLTLNSPAIPCSIAAQTSSLPLIWSHRPDTGWHAFTILPLSLLSLHTQWAYYENMYTFGCFLAASQTPREGWSPELLSGLRL